MQRQVMSPAQLNRGRTAAVSPTTRYLQWVRKMRLSIIDEQKSSSTQPVELLAAIFSQAFLQPTANTPRTPNKRSLVTAKQWPGPCKHPIAVAPRWVPLPVVTPSRAKRCRTVEFKLRVLSWAEHGRIDDGIDGQRKPTREEVRVRFGLKQKNQVLKWKKVCSKIVTLLLYVTD